MIKCSVDGCLNARENKGFCNKHYLKFKKYGNPLAGYEKQSKNGEGSARPGRYHRMRINGKEKLQHVIIAEKAIGKPLPSKACIHHWNENKHDNRPENLLVCPDQAYHMLIHMRQRAFNACGHADWLRCRHCKQYDAPENLYVNIKHGAFYHRACEAVAKRKHAQQQSNQGEK